MHQTIITLLKVVAFPPTGMIGCSRKQEQGALEQPEKIRIPVTP